MEAKPNLLAGRRTQISLLLTVIATLLWAHSILYARFEIGYLGLINGLPATFFIALALLTVASAILWVDKEKHSKLLLLQLLLFISALGLIPLVTGGSPQYINHDYSNLGFVNYIAHKGTFSSRELWYLSWPGAHILFAIMTILGAINFEPLLSVSPILILIASLLPLYLLLRNILGEERTNYCWAGLWLFCLGSWIGETFMSPQGIAYLLLLIILALITCPSLWKKDSPKSALLSMVGLLAAAIVPTHLLTSLALVLMLAALSAAKRSKILLPIIGLCLVLIVSWDVTGGGHIFESVTSHPLLSVAMEAPDQQAPTTGIFTVNPANIAKTEITQHLRGSESHIAVVKVRILHASIFTLIGLAGAVFVLLRRRTSNTIAILAITLAPLLLLPISGHYGEELLNRVYLFVLPFMGYFGAMLLDMRGKLPWLVFCLLLIVAIPTNIISTYGNQALDYFPEGRVAGLKFFDSTTTYGYVTGAYPLGDTGNILQYKHLDYPQLEWQGNDLATRAGEDIPYYIAISNYDRAWYEWFLGNPYYVSNIEQLLDNAGNCSLIYCNPVLKIYESNK